MTFLSSFIHVFLSPAMITAASSRGGASYNEETIIAIFVTAMIITLFSGLIYYVINSIFLMKLFSKANVPAWKAWVPVVNIWKFLELGGYPGAISLLVFAGIIPFIGWAGSLVYVVFSCMAAYQIGLKNGKDGVWVILYIFLPLIWTGILGLGRSTWNDHLGKPALGVEQPPASPYYGTGMPQ